MVEREHVGGEVSNRASLYATNGGEDACGGGKIKRLLAHFKNCRHFEIASSFDLGLLVKTLTIVTATTQSAIDYIITNHSSVAVSVVNTADPDHYGQEAVISGRVVQGSFQEIATIDSKFWKQLCFFMSKCALTRGQDIHMYETRGRANYRHGRHRTVVYERLPSQAVVHFFNRLPNSIKDAPMPKALKTRLNRF
ncbi:hypothetical protein J6590_026855 [Homalodisca vitripennis]|nr:hypothetical protein J6590_026855 [Homalodisca vitripennis]